MTSPKPSPAAIARQALAFASARDSESLRALLDPQVQVEWPYAGRTPVVFSGVDEALKSFALADQFVTFMLEVDALYEASDGVTVIAEAHSRGTLSDGRRDYENRYVFRFTIQDGRIQHWREYFNPIEGGRVFGKVG